MADPRETELDPDRHQRLARDLSALTAPPFDIPRRVDEAVLAQARETLAPSRLPRRASRRWLGWAAAAAAIGLVGWVACVLGPRPSAPPGARTGATVARSVATGDLDGNGRVDILDAFGLARALAAQTVPATADMNGDGLVDHADVEIIAIRAVRLDEGAG